MSQDITLTWAEMASLSTWDDGSYHCPCQDECTCDDSEKFHLFDAVKVIVQGRLVAVTALVDEWETYDAEGYAAGDGPDWWARTEAVRAALSGSGNNDD